MTPQEHAAAVEVEKLRALANNATGGDWSWEDGPATIYAGRTNETHGLNLLGRLYPDWNGKHNLDYICAASPKNISALIDRLAAAEATFKLMQEIADNQQHGMAVMAAENIRLREKLDASEKQAGEYRKALEALPEIERLAKTLKPAGHTGDDDDGCERNCTACQHDYLMAAIESAMARAEEALAQPRGQEGAT
jgi:hypothetical protein